MKRNVDAADVLFVVGLGATTFGLSQVYPPLLFIFPGAVLMWMGYVGQKGG